MEPAVPATSDATNPSSVRGEAAVAVVALARLVDGERIAVTGCGDALRLTAAATTVADVDGAAVAGVVKETLAAPLVLSDLDDASSAVCTARRVVDLVRFVLALRLDRSPEALRAVAGVGDVLLVCSRRVDARTADCSLDATSTTGVWRLPARPRRAGVTSTALDAPASSPLVAGTRVLRRGGILMRMAPSSGVTTV